MRAILRADVFVVGALATVACALGWWATARIGIPVVYSVIGIMIVLWVSLDVLLRRVMKEQASEEQNSLVREVISDGRIVRIWPPLPTSPLVQGRPATPADVARGEAVFVMQDISKGPGVPVEMVLPQYGEFGTTPVAVVQAESDGTTTFLGLLDFESGSFEVAELEEVTLLGQAAPNGSSRGGA